VKAKRCDASRKDKKKKTLDFGGCNTTRKLYKDKAPKFGRRGRVVCWPPASQK